ncbi:death-associated protein 1 isoform X1 [Ascaphus truei]|uniref:death-associated protein 1 isoform X1 n=1 Tax=Ascaphus truei TaxID=8439 RepID=UPI003F5A85A1
MSSPPKEKTDTKAGHLPAVKAGGMRIVQKHPHTPHVEVKEEKEKDNEEENWESGIAPPKPTLIISGAVTRGMSISENTEGCSSEMVTRTFPQLQLKWLIRNLILLWKSCLLYST